jgi:hypothetical protein
MRCELRVTLSLDKSAAIPSQRSRLSIDVGYLDRGRVLIAKQPDIAGMYRKDSTISSVNGDIYLVQTSCGVAMNRRVAAAEIIKVERDEFSSGNGEVKRKLLGGRQRSAAGGFPLLYIDADLGRQIAEMSGIPAILRYPAMRRRRLSHSRQTQKRDCNR